MSSGHTHHEQHGGHGHHHGPRPLPGILNAPAEVLAAWRRRALIFFGVFTVISLLFAFTHEGRNHIFRAYLSGSMLCFGFAGGGLCMLMLQYVSGGKWGLLLRRPLEAMSRTLPLVAVFYIPFLIPALGKHLWQWVRFPTIQAERDAYAHRFITQEQELTAIFKYRMLNPHALVFETVLIFAVLGLIAFLLSKWSLERDADPEAGTNSSYEYWRVKFENLSGPGIFIYVVLLTLGAIVWIKALDVTWYSSIWGLQFLVAQGYAVLALGILSVILLSRYEPMRTILRTTEQADLGKLAFAFVMLNIYLTFAEFLIIWSGNVPDEIPWYLARIHGGWWVICSADWVFHWLVPFSMLLSRDLKKNKTKMIWLCCWMLFARVIDMFWIIEPNFRYAAGNLIHEPLSIVTYLTVPLAVFGAWGAFYITNLMDRPLVTVNDPHLEEILEPEHAH